MQGYNGSQSFNFKGELVEAKYPDGLRQFDAVKEAAEAMHIVQRSLHEDIEAAVLNKSVFDVWGILRALYESDTDSTIAEKYRVLDHMWYGDKEGEPMHEFLTRWRMAVREFMHVTGVESTDSYRSAMLERTLPRKWRSTLASWRGKRPFIPTTELEEKAIAEEKLWHNSSDPLKTKAHANTRHSSQPSQPRENTTPKSCREPPMAKTAREVVSFCFYCLKDNHKYRHCKYLEIDTKMGSTHKNRSQYSCRVTEKRTPAMVRELEAYITKTSKHRPSVLRGDTKRKHDISLPRDDVQVIQNNKYGPPQVRSAAHRSRSVHPSTSGFPTQISRSRSVYNDGRCTRSPSAFRGNWNFYFQRQRHLGASL